MGPRQRDAPRRPAELEAPLLDWTLRYDNYGNGGFSEWWELLFQGSAKARFYEKAIAERLCAFLNTSKFA